MGSEALPQHGSTQRPGTRTSNGAGFSLITDGHCQKKKAKNSLHYLILKISLTEMNAVFATAIRTFSAASALTIFQYSPWIAKTTSTVKRTDLKKLSLIALSGMLGYGIGGLAYVLAMQRIGAGRTVLITSLTPALVLILSVLFLKERPTRRSVIGTVVCVVGVMCLSL
jgi:uncharacterized membrane protein